MIPAGTAWKRSAEGSGAPYRSRATSLMVTTAGGQYLGHVANVVPVVEHGVEVEIDARLRLEQ